MLAAARVYGAEGAGQTAAITVTHQHGCLVVSRLGQSCQVVYHIDLLIHLIVCGQCAGY